jgi:hypothetical protein
MFKFVHKNAENEDVTYRIVFNYDLEPVLRETRALIVLGGNKDKDGKVVAFGTARCSSGDNFSRNTGRKIALARALTNFGLEKSERTSVWESYFKIVGKKKA